MSVAPDSSPAPIKPWEVLDLLTGLVQKSLVVYEEDAQGHGRYLLLETVRQYAQDRLIESGEAETVQGRHLDFFLELAERAEPELRRHDQIEWLDRLETEHDNLRAALEWCAATRDGGRGMRDEKRPAVPHPSSLIPHPSELGLRLAGALMWFWEQRSHLSEGRQYLEAALSQNSGAPARLRMRALRGAGRLTLGAQGDPAAAVRFLHASLDLARATNDPEGTAMALASLAVQAAIGQDGEQAAALAEESLVRARAAGDPWLIAWCLHVLGLAVRRRGDLERAASLFRESLALMQPVGDRLGMFFVLVNLGGAAQARGDLGAARRAYQEALVCSHELRNRVGIAMCLECPAEVATEQGQAERGARLSGAAGGLLEAIGASWPPPYVAGREHALAAIRAALGDESAAAAVAEGRAMPLEQAVALALEQSNEATD